MYFYLKNQNVKDSYPLLPVVAETHVKFYKETGFSDTIVNINTAEDLMSICSCCETQYDDFKGLLIKGNTVKIINGGIPE